MTDLRSMPHAGAYSVIEADPPWHHASYSVKGQARSPSRYYRTMSKDEICAMPVADVAARDCHLMLWTTQPHLEQSFDVMRAWGFRYSSVFIFWLKLNPKAADVIWMRTTDFSFGMGFTTRKNVEMVLLGRRGKPQRLRKDIPDILIAARRQHSRKPDSFYSLAAEYAPGPRLSMFTRETREGWDSWGDEAEKFDTKGPGKVDPRARYVGQDEMFGPPWPWPTTPLLDAA